MPTYDYRCKDCTRQFEARHGISAPAPSCPRCGGNVERVILQAPAAHGQMARGREQAMRSLQTDQGGHRHGPGCGCSH